MVGVRPLLASENSDISLIINFDKEISSKNLPHYPLLVKLMKVNRWILAFNNLVVLIIHGVVGVSTLEEICREDNYFFCASIVDDRVWHLFLIFITLFV